MARKVFFSFHYVPDSHRAAQIRQAGVLDGNQVVTDNDWETVTKAGDRAIERWIDEQMHGKSCCVVLIGNKTAGRKWINYEITKAWNAKKGVVGVYIHGLKNLAGYTAFQGSNPFRELVIGERSMADIVKAYNPSGMTSKGVYASIVNNLPDWVEEAISIRGHSFDDSR